MASPAILEQASHQAQAESGFYDLIIYDDCVPARMPRANTLLFGRVPPGDTWQAKPGETPPHIIDVDLVHPLTQLVEMDFVKIAQGMALEPPPGSTVLFDSVIGPLFAVGPREGFEDAVLGFTLFDRSDAVAVTANTSWPLRSSFPVFVFNSLRYLGGVRGALAVSSVAPGTAVTLRSPADVTQITVIDPGGRRTILPRNAQSTFIYTGTEEVGVYEVRENERPETVQLFVVNLFDERESNLEPATRLELGHEVVSGSLELKPARREMWKWILLLGLAVLLFEWYVYNRRVYL